MNKNLYHQEIWDAGYENFDFFEASSADPVATFLRDHSGSVKGTCFEVGCFPGRYMAFLGRLGWVVNGVDLTPHVHDLELWLREKNCSVGKIWHGDFTNFDTNQKFDLVYSCGFVEHFIDFQEIIRKHASLVKPGGLLIITTPNFTRLQGVLHKFFDDENFRRHNVHSMNLDIWSSVLKDEGFSIQSSCYFGKFAFWTGWQPRPDYKKFLLNKFNKLVPYLSRKINFDSPQLSPFLGIVAQKKSV